MSLLRNLNRLLRRSPKPLNSFKRFSTKIEQPEAANIEPASMAFPGIRPGTTISTTPNLIMPDDFQPIPIYRVLDREGNFLDESQDPKLDRETISKLFRTMVQMNTVDKILYESQRQGRISFYMTNFGEEASQIGSAAALSPDDLVYAQYREAAVLLYRGFTISQFIDQCYGNVDDEGKGRQMPVHYGSRKLNFVTISSPLGTQIPQAAGSAYVFKRDPNNNRCVICYFGDGAASEGDAHAAFNFAATLDCPVIFFCRNNGYAISTPVSDQYRGDGIASRAVGYGMATLRLDGTDIFAVYNGIKTAREFAIKNNKPIMVEAMQCRLGHHSTSDDSTAYRDPAEIEVWNSHENPINKLKNYMIKQGWFNEDEEKAFVASIRKQVLSDIQLSERKLKPDWREMFTDVYDDIPPQIKKQMDQLGEHLELYKNEYPLKDFKA